MTTLAAIRATWRSALGHWHHLRGHPRWATVSIGPARFCCITCLETWETA